MKKHYIPLDLHQLTLMLLGLGLIAICHPEASHAIDDMFDEILQSLPIAEELDPSEKDFVFRMNKVMDMLEAEEAAGEA